MKKLFLTLLAVVFCGSAFAEQVIVKEYNYAGPYEFDTPFMVDSTNVNSRKYTRAELLKNYVDVESVCTNSRAISTDDEGKLPQLSTSKDAIHLVGFHVNTDRFVNPDLLVAGVRDYTLYVNGKQTPIVNGRLRLDILPNSRHDFIIKYATMAEDSVSFSVRFDTRNSTANLVPTLDRQQKYSLKQMQYGRRTQSAAISHDGKWLILNFGERFLNDRTNVETIITERATGKVLWTRPAGPNSIRMMPKSNLAYYTRADDRGQSIITIDPYTGIEKVFASGIPSSSMRIAPTEDFVMYSQSENAPAERGDVQEILSPQDRAGGGRSRRFIYKYDFNTGVATRLTFGHTSTSLQDISPDGKKMLFTVSRFVTNQRTFNSTDVLTMDLATMKVDTLIENELHLGGVEFSPDGHKILITGGPESFGGIGLDIAEGQMANGYDTQAFVFDINTREVTPITKNLDPKVRSAYWNDYDNLVYILGEEGDKSTLYSIDPVKLSIKRIELEEEYVNTVRLSSGSPHAVYYGQSIGNAQRLYTYDRKSRKSKLVADLSEELLKDVKLGEAGDWNFESSQGGTIHGLYYLPPDFDPSKKYPMLVYYYAGTNPTPRSLEGTFAGQIYASLGYVFYVVQPSGATGYGQEFSARHVNAWGKRTAEDIIEGVTKFCDSHEFVDRSKIGCFGASYGGFMTQYLQTRTDIFAAAISHAGISSIASYWGQGYSGYGYNTYATAGNFPWNAPEIYATQSPLFNADKVNTPILFLHGSVDTNVPIGESVQMFTALKLLGKETAFVEVKGENHNVADPERVRKWSYTMYAWFAKWLQDSPDWWNSMYPPKDL